MPRRRKRSSRLSPPFPLTFSKFGQLLAYSAFKCESRQQLNGRRLSTCHSENEGGDKNVIGESKRELESSDDDYDDDGEVICFILEILLSFLFDSFFGPCLMFSCLKKEVQADFGFFDPKPDDFHGVKALLMTFLDSKAWDLSGFVDLILGQTTVGTVIKIENSDDNGPFSVSSALNFGRYEDHQCMKELKEFLFKICPDKIVLNDLKIRLRMDAHSNGVLVSQRVINLPYQLLPPLYDSLFDEILWATEDEPTEELRKSFCFKSYIIISKIYLHKDFLNSSLIDLTDETVTYVKVEDELFLKLSSWHFCFPLHNEQTKAHELKNFRPMGVVMAVEADKIPDFRKQLHSLIDGC